MIFILFLFTLGISNSVFAQMIDLMGNLTIDGMMNTQAVKGYNAINLLENILTD